MIAQAPYWYFYSLSDPAIIIDIFLTALIMGLIGCIAYVIFIESMSTDRKEARMKMLEKSMKAENGIGMDLWGALAGENTEDDPKEKETSPKSKASKIVIIILLALIAVVFIIRVAVF